MPSFFRIRFEIEFGVQDTSDHRNIFRITDNVDDDPTECRKRYPAMYIEQGSETSIGFCHCINGFANVCSTFHQS